MLAFGRSRHAGQCDAELLRERLGDEIHTGTETRSIILAGQERAHRIADPAHPRIGKKSLGATPGRDEQVPGAGPVVAPWHEQHHDPEVLPRIARLPLATHPPFAADLEGNIACLAPTEIRPGDDGDLAARLLAHLGDHVFHVRHGFRGEDVREIVDVAHGGGDGDLNEEDEREGDHDVRKHNASGAITGQSLW